MSKRSQILLYPYANFQKTAFDFWGSPIGTNPDGTLYCPGFTMLGDIQGGAKGHANAYLKDAYSSVAIAVEGPLQDNEQAKTPGKCIVSIDKGRGLDMKKPAGADGERATWKGITAGRIALAIQIWTPEQYRQFLRLWNHIAPPANKSDPAAFKVYHPELRVQGISALQFYKLEGPNEGPVSRARTYMIQAVEFIPPTKKNTTKTNTQTHPTTHDPPKPPTPGSNPKNTNP